MSRNRCRMFPAARLVDMFSHDTETRQIASILGTSRHTIYKWVSNEVHISEWAADKHAVKLGLHPSAVWSNWFNYERTEDE
jgi:plasmid maintenance system antidote protein VapI